MTSLSWFAGPLIGALAVALPVLLLGLLALRIKQSKWRLGLAGAFFSLAASQLLIFWWDASGLAAEKQFGQVSYMLASPAQWQRHSELNVEQSIIALSFLAEGLANYASRHPAAQPASRNLIGNALAVLLDQDLCPFADLTDTTAWAKRVNNLYLSHLNVVLGCYAPIARTSVAEARYAKLHGQISRYFAAQLATAPSGNLPSYGNTLRDTLWTADNAVTVHSLWLYDQAQQQFLSVAASRRWLRLAASPAATSHGLPYSELTAHRPPRGCALSWLAKYMAAFASDQAATWWTRYKQSYKYNLGVASLFREYEPGVTLPEDYDSGPTVMGAGAAATGLALSGAKYQGDYYTYYQVLTTVLVVDLAAKTMTFIHRDPWGGATDNWLAKSIRFNAAAKL